MHFRGFVPEHRCLTRTDHVLKATAAFLQHEKRRERHRPRLPFRFPCSSTRVVRQQTPGPAGQQIIPVSVIDIEMVRLVVPVVVQCQSTDTLMA